MIFFQTCVVAFSMFSRIPMPQFEWNERNMRYMLAAFPLVGVATGALICGWVWLCGAAGFGRELFAAGLLLCPVVVTGGIHLDGFCDVCDALASHAAPERRREIMKDSHSGAFAIIGTGGYMLAYYALGCELGADGIPAVGAVLPLVLCQVMSRAASGFCSITYPASGSKGLLGYFRGVADRRRAAGIDAVVFITAAAVAVALSPVAGALCAAAVFAAAVVLYPVSKICFGGMSGDLSGWFLQVAELAALAAFIVAERLVIV